MEHTKIIYKKDEFIEEVKYRINNQRLVNAGKGVYYYNIPCSFDIETTSIIQEDEKKAYMYEFTFCIEGIIFIGRDWETFDELIKSLVHTYGLCNERRLVVYVHNLSFEFQFLRKRFEWISVFSLDKREPVKALQKNGIEFRCSYLLSGYSLAKVGDQLLYYEVEKMVGDLDYEKVRHSNTPLTEKEIRYCVNDCLVVVAYIQELIDRLGNINKIPMTKTGFVRNYCRKMCLYGGEGKRDNEQFHTYNKLMNKLQLTIDGYVMAKKAFKGGFTHANPLAVSSRVENVHSFDFTSSYPYCAISEKFPMSQPQDYMVKDIYDLEYQMYNYCCVFDIELYNVKPKVYYDNYISVSHCKPLKNCEENNGRVVTADYLKTTVTEQDFYIIREFYTWDKCDISNFIRMEKNYLPKQLVLSILNKYVDKTVLKGVEGKEVEYLNSKENINSIYGMMVTDILRDKIVYENDEWYSEEPDKEQGIISYNKNVKRFLYYFWGIYITAYARRNLFTGIMEFGDDYIYSDTDSIKVVNIEKHMDYIKNYNNDVIKKLEKAMAYHGIDMEMTRPKTIKGEVKQIGIWDYEGCYEEFKTLGAKRYIIKKKNAIKIDGVYYNYSITVSGINKYKAIPYLYEKYGENIMDAFNEDFYVPADYTGKLTHTYIDDEILGEVIDYKGNKGTFHEYSAVHLGKADYSLSLMDKYVQYFMGIQQREK